jgi:hypothetical protein
VWRKADTPHIVQGLLNKLDDYFPRPLLMQTLRCLVVDIASRRRGVGDPPQSPRYFERSIARRIEEWKRPLIKAA